MHELSLAMELVERLDVAARREQAERITRVEIVIGALSGVEVEAFAFAFPVAASGHAAEGAELAVTYQDGRLACDDCGHEESVDEPWMVCGACGSQEVRVVRGEEFSVRAMEIE